MKIYRLSFLIVVIVLGGCATSSQKALSPMQIRQISTRILEGSYEDTYRATMTVLQDQGYVIQNTDMNSGLIVARVDRETSGGSQLMQAFFFGRVYDKNSLIEVSATVGRLTPQKTDLRLILQETTYGQTTAWSGSSRQNARRIHDVSIYKALFDQIAIEVERRKALQPGSQSLSTQTPAREDSSASEPVSLSSSSEQTASLTATEKSVSQINYRIYAALNLTLDETTKNLWVDGVEWWTSRIREKCGGVPEISALKDKGDDWASLPEANIRFTTHTEAWPSWVLGEDALKGYLNPSTTPRDFHIALFKEIKALRGKGLESVNGHYISPNIMVLTSNVQDLNKNANIHLIGRLFGLSPGDGGIMSPYYVKGPSRPPIYVDLEKWPETWCEKIAKHLNK